MKEILFFGDSLTAGYGLTDPEQTTFPARISQAIKSAGLSFRVCNAGLSGDTTVAAFPRLAPLLHDNIALFILELGANDFLRGHDPEMMYEFLCRMVLQVKKIAPRAVILLLGIEIPIWVPATYQQRYAHIYPDLAAAFSLAYISDFMAPIKGKKQFHLPDGLHPLASGYELIAEYIWPVTKTILDKS
ncbi:GDSL-type esterase/lipase family protein [Pedobacter aquatilis]|uniref:GDSL-type esterase/lipase family protein n=1 Tax=Pedobacter aquatilis TaxID=351343 RepID=UPI0029313E23|nr:GDSL-type esterase/lipase family protein [Pedobacter aquatilis]